MSSSSEEDDQTLDEYRQKIINRTWDGIVHPAFENKPNEENLLMEGVIKTLEIYFTLKEDPIFEILIRSVKNQLNKDMDLNEAIKYIVSKRKFKILEIFNE